VTQECSCRKYKVLWNRVCVVWVVMSFFPLLHPQSLTAKNLKMIVSTRDLLYQGTIFEFHVKLQGCILFVFLLFKFPTCPLDIWVKSVFCFDDLSIAEKKTRFHHQVSWKPSQFPAKTVSWKPFLQTVGGVELDFSSYFSQPAIIIPRGHESKW